jgi:hypothetical protein
MHRAGLPVRVFQRTATASRHADGVDPMAGLHYGEPHTGKGSIHLRGMAIA